MITLKDFLASNIPIEVQVTSLGQFLIENFEIDIGGSEQASGEGAIEMAVRLLLKYKTGFAKQQKLIKQLIVEKRKLFTDDSAMIEALQKLIDKMREMYPTTVREIVKQMENCNNGKP